MEDLQFGDEVCGVLSGVDCKGFGDDKESLGELGNGELFSGPEGSGEVVKVD